MFYTPKVPVMQEVASYSLVGPDKVKAFTALTWRLLGFIGNCY